MSTRFTALTIKEGDAFLLEDNGRNCLFDSGVNETIVNILKYKGIVKLDLAICSHNDADHAKGFIALLQSNIKIKEIWLPSFWLSILQYVEEYGVDWTEIDRHNEEINERIKDGLSPDMVFSNDSKPITNYESNKTLSYFATKLENDHYRRCQEAIIQQDIVNQVTDELRLREDVIVPPRIVHKITKHLIDGLPDYHDQKPFPEIILEVTLKLYRDLGNNSTKYSPKRIDDTLNEYLSYLGLNYYIQSDYVKQIEEYFDNIRNLAVLAHRRGCKIKWFKPTQSCPCNPVKETGFIALNSDECQVSRIQDNIMAFAMALHLTEVNEYSLVFEYLKDGIPIIRFSADSNSECQSKPYINNIIVTAPHHGSKNNANVYKNLVGEDIIWVRSNSASRISRMPCRDFLLMKNKYCLACEAYNFKSEICFEYNPWDLQWHHVHGEQCRCKP